MNFESIEGLSAKEINDLYQNEVELIACCSVGTAPSYGRTCWWSSYWCGASGAIDGTCTAYSKVGASNERCTQYGFQYCDFNGQTGSIGGIAGTAQCHWLR